MAANLYLDFGDNFPMGGLQLTADQLGDFDIRDVNPGIAGAASIEVRGDVLPSLMTGNTIRVTDRTGAVLQSFTVRAGSVLDDNGTPNNLNDDFTVVNVNEAITNGGTVDNNARFAQLTAINIQGPNLNGRGSATDRITSNEPLQFTGMQGLLGSNFDYNNDSTTNAADYTDLRADVLALVQRYYASFDVNVLIAPALDNTSSATYLTGIQNQLAQGANTDGERDAWVFIVGATRTANGATVRIGNDVNINGIAAGADIPGSLEAAQPNARDDSVLTCADVILSGLTGTDIYKADNRLAYTVAHEAAHSFGLWHLWNGEDDPVANVTSGTAGNAAFLVRGNRTPDLIVGNTIEAFDANNNSLGTFTIRAGSTYNSATGLTTINVDEAIANGGAVDNNSRQILYQYNTDQTLIISSDIIPGSVGETNRVNFDFFTRFDLLGDYAVDFLGNNSAYSPYSVLARNENLGLKANSPAYVTGTGAFDRITITRVNATTANVTVEAFREAAFTNQVRSTLSYQINITNGILIEAGFSDDEIILDGDLNVNITVRGMAGFDTLKVLGKGAATGSYTPSATVNQAHPNGDALDERDSYSGTVVIGMTNIFFEEFEPLTISNVVDFTFTTPGSQDSVRVRSDADGQNTITGTSDSVPFESLTFFDITNFTVDLGANDGANPNDTFRMRDPLVASGLQTFTVQGGAGNDTFLVLPSTVAAITINGGDPQTGDPGVPPGDVLAVDLTGVNGASLPPKNASSGTITSTTHKNVSFTSIETFITSDRFEINDTLAQATILGSDPFVTLRDLSIHNGDDIDVFRITAHDTGMLIITAIFDAAVSNLDIVILDARGNIITPASQGAGTGNNEVVSIPVVGQQAYYIAIFSPDEGVNNYSLEIENFKAPLAGPIDLNGNDDTGRSDIDNNTRAVAPRLRVQADLSELMDRGIAILTAAQAAAGVTSGAAIQVFVNGVAVGFANPIAGTGNSLFEFTLNSNDLDDNFAVFPPGTAANPERGWENLITAAVRIFDGQQNAGNPAPVSGRGPLSTPLILTFDNNAPEPSTPDLASSSDSIGPDPAWTNSDNVTKVNAPTFQGIGEANAIVRIFANGLLVGQGVVGSDDTDGTPGDGLGAWEATINPLADGTYTITTRLEDLAGNLGAVSTGLNITIDTLPPQRPTIDLTDAADSGRNNKDNITNPNFYAPNTLQFRVDAEPGAYVVIKSGDTVIDAFIMPGAGFALREVAAFTTDRTYLLSAEATDRAGNRSLQSEELNVTVDTAAPLAPTILLHPSSDTGVSAASGTFTDNITSVTTPRVHGLAEADTIVQLTVGVGGNTGAAGLTVAVPYDGNHAFLNGQWELVSGRNLNDPALYSTRDGLRLLSATAEDLAGNVSQPGELRIFLDTQGPAITGVFNTAAPGYNLFDPTPADSGPTPLVHQLSISVRDLPNRVGSFPYDALQSLVASNPGAFTLKGDHNGNIGITRVQVIADANVAGQPATATIVLTFDAALPDDRYTLIVLDTIVDPVGNRLDGESNGLQPLGLPQFPTGDGVSGGNFVARFTVDSRPEISTVASSVVSVDINGNGFWDPTGASGDQVNRDLTFLFGLVSDAYFAGNFLSKDGQTLSGFDKIAVYGKQNGVYRFMLDLDHNGTFNGDKDLYIVSGLQINAVPIAGNFKTDRPGDEIGLFDGVNWYLDTNGNNNIDSGDRIVVGLLRGIPIVGDFDGDGLDDLATYQPGPDLFQFDFASNGFGQIDDTHHFPMPGVTEKPVAADMNQDGITDIGLFVPGQIDPSRGAAQWYFLVSDTTQTTPATGSAVTLKHAFNTAPFTKDLMFSLGDSFSLPLVGNFDPPLGIANTAPVMGNLANLSVHGPNIGPIALSAVDAELDPISFSARALTSDPRAYQVKQEFGLTQNGGSYHQNAQGRNGKWFYSPSSGAWYALLPSGELYRWNGSWAASTLAANLDPYYYQNPDQLLNAPANPSLAPVNVTLTGNQLSLQTQAGASGTFFVEVTASDGQANTVKYFSVTLTNQAPALVSPGPRTMTTGQNSIQVDLLGSDADGDALTYTAQLVGSTPLALQLKQQLGFSQQGGSYHENAQGLGEKWLYNETTGVWHAILPNGELRRWTGNWASSPIVAQLETFFHADPSLLWNAQAVQPLAYQLKHTHGLAYAGSYYHNAHGRNEKWLYNPTTGVWFALVPTSTGVELRRLTGAVSTIDQASNLLGTLDRAYWNNPAYLHDARPDSIVPVFLTVNGSQVTIDPASGYTGTFLVAATVSDGQASQTRYFSVNVTNTAPVLQALPDLNLTASGPIGIHLQASDADGDILIYSAQVRTIEAEAHRLRTALGVSFTGSYHETAHGLNAKWLYNTTSGVWYAILTNGEVRRWTGSVDTLLSQANLEGKLDATYWADPSKLLNAAPVSGATPATVGINGNQLIVTPLSGMNMTLVVDAFVSDGTATVKRTFVVKVS